MLKVINPQVAKFEYTTQDKKQKLGTNAALLFQHICYWMQTQDVDVAYRTNQQLSEDLEGALSVSQVARAKAKLIQAGLITIAQDLKKRFIHTTHYRLTTVGEQVVMALESLTRKVKAVAKQTANVVKQTVETVNTIVDTAKVVVDNVVNPKGEFVNLEQPPVMDETTKLLIEEQAQLEGKTFQEVADQYAQPVGANNTQPVDLTKQHTKQPQQSVKPTTKSATKPKKWIPKEEYRAMKQAEYKQQQNKEMVVSASMKKSFDEGFSNPNAVKGIPQELLNKLPAHLRKRAVK